MAALKAKAGDGPDINMFDGAQEQVVEYMSKSFYPNFLKSDIFVEFVQVRLSKKKISP